MTSPKATGRRPEIETELVDRYHVDYTLLVGVPTDQFDIDRSLSNQARFKAIDDTTVEEYSEAVKRGDVFPAVLAYRPGRGVNAKLVIIDGNHRLVAHHKVGQPVSVYEIDRKTRPQTITMMTYAFNTRHGKPTNELERVHQALHLIENGASQERAAEAVQVPMRILRKAVAAERASRRASEAGVDMREWESITGSTRNRLLNISTDEGFHGAVHLAYAAKLNFDEVSELISLLNTSKSGAKQRSLVRSETERYFDRIQASAGGVLTTADRRSVTPRSRIGMVLGAITAIPDDLTRVYSEAERHEVAVRMLDGAEKLRKMALSVDPGIL